MALWIGSKNGLFQFTGEPFVPTVLADAEEQEEIWAEGVGLPDIAFDFQIDFHIRRGDDEDGPQGRTGRPVRSVFDIRTVAEIPWQWPSVLMGEGCDDDNVVGLRLVHRDFADACDEI